MGLHIFDLDGTLIRKNSSFAFYFFLVKRGKLSVKSLISAILLYSRYRAGLSLRDLHFGVFKKLLYQQPLALFLEEVDPFLDCFLEKTLRKALLDATAKEMRWLFSSTPEFLVAPIAQRLGFPLWKGTEYEIDASGRISGIASLVDGEKKKLLASKSPFQREEIIAYSDSIDDLPLLEWAGRVNIVSPDRFLLRYAKKKRWKIWEEK